MSRKKKKGGAPSKLKDEVRKKILDNLRACLPYEHAAALAEVDARTFWRWKKRGLAEPTSVYGSFVREMRMARAAGLARLGATAYVGAMGDPGNDIPPDPRLCLDILGRRAPDHWGSRKQVDLGNAKGQPFKTESVEDDGLLEHLEHIEKTVRQRKGG